MQEVEGASDPANFPSAEWRFPDRKLRRSDWILAAAAAGALVGLVFGAMTVVWFEIGSDSRTSDATDVMGVALIASVTAAVGIATLGALGAAIFLRRRV